MKTPNLDSMIDELIVISVFRPLTISEELCLKEFQEIKKQLTYGGNK
jgi:hypothetical protein